MPLFRKQFRDRPIASHQLVQEKLVWMITRNHQGATADVAGGPAERPGQGGFQHISMAKRNNVWMALECARLARDILGANGMADEYPVFRHMAIWNR